MLKISTGPDVLLGVAVAVEAPLHLKAGHLPGQLHLLNLAVTTGTADAFLDVNAVVEVDEIGQVVDAVPGTDLPVR